MPNLQSFLTLETTVSKELFVRFGLIKNSSWTHWWNRPTKWHLCVCNPTLRGRNEQEHTNAGTIEEVPNQQMCSHLFLGCLGWAVWVPASVFHHLSWEELQCTRNCFHTRCTAHAHQLLPVLMTAPEKVVGASQRLPLCWIIRLFKLPTSSWAGWGTSNSPASTQEATWYTTR